MREERRRGRMRTTVERGLADGGAAGTIETDSIQMGREGRGRSARRVRTGRSAEKGMGWAWV
jgi:hypothetical protein